MGWLLAALSGLLVGLSFPTVIGGRLLPDLGFFAFFSWIPLFQAVRSVRPRQAMALGFFAGLFQFSLSMYWLYTAMNSFGGLSPVISVLMLLLLVTVLSLYFSLVFFLSQWISQKLAVPVYWIRPIFWVAIEYLRGHVPTGGFPWSQIAYSQGGFLHFIQSADLFGVYLTVFLLVSVNEIGSVIFTRLRFRTQSLAVPYLVFVTALFVMNLLYGHYRLTQPLPTADQTLKAGVVQGNIPQDEKWLSGAASKILDIYREGTLGLQEQGAQLILWPEASYPLALPSDLKEISMNLEGLKSDLLVGAITRPSHFRGYYAETPYYNSALLIDADGQVFDIYHKRHLVPFGEYIPWKDLLFFARKLTVEVGNLMPGETYRPLDYRGSHLGILICYEDIFPEIARKMVAAGANALINTSNDAWYGNSSAAYQHQVFSQFRAVETRRALVRATNTGLSSMIDRSGKILWQGELFVRQNFLSELPYYHDHSLFVKVGDLFPVVCLSFLGVTLLLAILRSRKNLDRIS
jgi:apolipoprotein N-acyltransferase